MGSRRFHSTHQLQPDHDGKRRARGAPRCRKIFRTACAEDADYEHDDEGPDDMPSHIRMVLTRTSESVPIVDGKMNSEPGREFSLRTPPRIAPAKDLGQCCRGIVAPKRARLR